MSKLLFSRMNSLSKFTFLKNKTPDIFLRKIQIFTTLNGKDIIQTKISQNDILLQNLKTAKDAKNILDVVGAHYKIMNNQHTMQALRSIFHLQKNGSSKLSTESVMSHPSFIELCKKLKYHSREIEVNEMIEALKIISYVGVKSNSIIVQILLQLIRHQINNLSIAHIIFLCYLMKHFESTPLTDALKIALPIVFDVNIKTKIDWENLTQLCDCLHFASQNQTSQHTVDLIVKALENFGHNLDAKSSKSIIWSLCDLPLNPSHEVLLQNSLEVTANNINKYTLIDIETILSKIIKRFSRTSIWFYNEKFMDTCAEYVMEKDLGFEKAVWTLRRFVQINHINYNLVDYIVEKCLENRHILVNSKPLVMDTVISGIVQSGYHEKHSTDIIKKAVFQSDILSSNYLIKNGATFATLLATLNVYDPQLLSTIFQFSNIERTLSKGNYWKCQHLLLMNQAVKYLNKSHEDMLPQNHVIDELSDKIYSCHRKTEFPTEAALQSAIGDSSCVITNIDAKLGYTIDHVIVMRKGGYPVALNLESNENKMITLEEVEQLACGNDILAIITFDPVCFSLNIHRLKYTYLLMIQILEARGLKVIPVSTIKWGNLLDHEKIPFLMQEIKNKTNSTDKKCNSVSINC